MRTLTVFLVLATVAFSVTAPAIASTVQERQQQLETRDTARYAENLQRCETALRVAKQCGTYAGTFYCDEKGFRAIPDAQRYKVAPRNDLSSYEMVECRRRAGQGGGR